MQNTFPNDRELLNALIHCFRDSNKPLSVADQEQEVVRFLDLSNKVITEKHSNSRTKLNYRLAWVRTYLKGRGYIHSPYRGVWELTRIADDNALIELKNDVDEIFDDDGIEGLDSYSPEPFIEYPIDSLLIRQETRTVFEVVRRIRDDRFVMDPDFQRDFIWGLEKQSKLIESILMRIPLPVFYLAENDEGKSVVVDGLQRLTTFKRYLDGQFELKKLELATTLEGKSFNDLPAKLQNRIEDTQLILYLIDSKVPEQAKLDIFERVNGGVPLTRQQMRNCIYSGQSTKWLKQEVLTNEFLEVTDGSLDSKSMRDRECVNRFCGFKLLGIESYLNGDMDAFLANTLRKMNRMTPGELDALSKDFRISLLNNRIIFGQHAFRKHNPSSIRRSVINVALFDVFSVLLSEYNLSEVETNRDRFKDIFFDLMNNDIFVDSITISTNATKKVKQRFDIAFSYFKGSI